MAGSGAERYQKPSIETKRGNSVANALLGPGCGGPNIFSKLLKCRSLFIAQSGQIAVECLLFRERFSAVLHNFFGTNNAGQRRRGKGVRYGTPAESRRPLHPPCSACSFRLSVFFPFCSHFINVFANLFESVH